MREPDALIALAEQGVKMALEMGADGAEIYAQETETSKVAASGRLIHPTSAAETSLGLRVSLGGRVGSSGASSAARLRAAIQEALRSVGGVAPAQHAFEFPEPRRDAAPRAVPHALGGDAEGQTDFIQQLVDAALADERVTFVECKLLAAHRRIAIANSRGLAAWDDTVSHRLEAEIRCTRGTTQRSGREASILAAPAQSLLDPARWIGDVVGRVGSALDARPLEGGPIEEAIFASVCASQVLGLASNAFVGRRDAVAPLGEARYSPTVTIRDEPRGPSGVRRRNVDDEGVPTSALTLVDGGRLVGLMHDTQSAARMGVASTGHGMRVVASGGVAPHSINLALEPGRSSFDELVAGAERAIIVPEPFLGGFTSNKTTGDFSVVTPYAFLVERGEIRHALGPTTIGGNAHRVLASVRDIGRDARACAAAVTPALRAGGVSCAA